MPDEQTDKVENTTTDIDLDADDDLYTENTEDPEILASIASTYNFQQFLDTQLQLNMDSIEDSADDTIEAEDSHRIRQISESEEDSDLVVVSVVLSKKQKENDEVAKAIERLRQNGVNCVFFTMNDIRNGNIKSDAKVVEALQKRVRLSQSATNPFASPALPELSPVVTTAKTAAASAQVSEITSTLMTPTISDSNSSSSALKRCTSGQKSPDITAISSSSSSARVSQSYTIRSSSDSVSCPSVSSTPKLTREWQEESIPPSIKKTEAHRSRSSTPPPPVLSPQVETEAISNTTADPISEQTISSCEKMEETLGKPKKKRRKRRRQSFYYRPAPKKRKICPFAQAVVKAEMNIKKEKKEISGSLLQMPTPELPPPPLPPTPVAATVPPVVVVKEDVEVKKSEDVPEVIVEESNKFPLRKGERVRVQVQQSVKVKVESVVTVKSKPLNGILKKVDKRKKKKKVVIQSVATDIVEKVEVKAIDDFLPKVEVKGAIVVDTTTTGTMLQKKPNSNILDDVSKAEVIEKLDDKPKVVKVKQTKKSKRWKGKRARRRKKVSQVVQPLRIKINGGVLRAFSPDITVMNSSLPLPPVVNCVQSISGKLDVQDDDKSIEDVQLKVDEIVKALEIESDLEDDPDEFVRPLAPLSCAILEEPKGFSTKEMEKEPIKIKTEESKTGKPDEQQTPNPTAIVVIKKETNDQKPVVPSGLTESKSDSIPDSPDAMQLRRSSFYSLISGNVRTNLEKYMDGRTTSCKTSKRRKRVKNGFLLHHGDNYPDDPESPYKLHLATQVLLKLNKRRAKFKPKEDRGKSLLSYLKLAPKRSPRIGKGPTKPQQQEEHQTTENERLPLFSGEWSLPRKFICNICGHGEDCFWDLVHHKGENHPGVLATHVELTHSPPAGLIRGPPVNTELNYSPPPCTKCSQKFSTFPDLHRHIFECAGNAAWLEEKTTRKKKAKRRRGFKRRLSNTPKKANGKKAETTTPKRRHSEVFKCEFCTREFKTEGWLKNHLVTHSLPVSIPLEKLSPPSRASLTSYRHVNVNVK